VIGKIGEYEATTGAGWNGQERAANATRGDPSPVDDRSADDVQRQRYFLKSANW